MLYKIKNNLTSVFEPVTIASFLILISAIISNLTSYKVIRFAGIEASLGTFTMPLILMLLNPIAEVYGKARSDQIIFSTCAMEICFAIAFTALSHVQKDCTLISSFSDRERCISLNSSYLVVSHNIIRGAISFSVGCLLGSYFNTKFLLYLKILWSSRRYYIRDIFSSMIGEVLYTAICFVMAFYGVFPVSTILKIFLFSLSFKFVSTIFLSWVSRFIVRIMSRHLAWSEAVRPKKKIIFSSRYMDI